MAADITAALVAGGAGLATALISLRESRVATQEAVAAKEIGQRTEQMRVKATEAGEKLLDALGGVLIAIDSVKSEAQLTGGIHDPAAFAPVGAAVGDAFRVLNGGAAIYLTAEIHTRVEEILHAIIKGGIPLEHWGDNLRQEFAEVALLFRTTYLDPVL